MFDKYIWQSAMTDLISPSGVCKYNYTESKIVGWG